MFEQMVPDYSAVLQQLVSAVQASAETSWSDIGALFLTTVSVAMVIVSTVLSRRMQQASEKQASAAQEAIREAVQQRQIAEQVLQESRKQHQFETQPIVVLEGYTDEFQQQQFRLLNLGRGPAFQVTVLSTETDRARVSFATIQHLSANTAHYIGFAVERIDTKNGATQVVPLGSVPHHIVAMVKSGRLPSPLPLRIAYMDLYGSRYTTVMEFATDERGRYGLHFRRTEGPSVLQPLQPVS
jgi:hypothetical protein